MFAELSIDRQILKDGYEFIKKLSALEGKKAIDFVHQAHQQRSTRQICRILGFRRQTYHRRRQGKQVRIINVMDEASRKALWTEAHQSISATKLVEILDHVVEYRGKPAYIRCHNGPEFIADKLKEWAKKQQIEIRFIQPGKLSQNGLVERLNKTLRTECLNLCWFGSLAELNEELQQWVHHYNTRRPHESLKHKAPEDYERLNQQLYYYLVVA